MICIVLFRKIILRSKSRTSDPLILYHTITTFNDPVFGAFENIVGKGENAGNQHCLLFPQCFLPFSKQISISESHIFCRLQILSILTGLKFCRLVKS